MTDIGIDKEFLIAVSRLEEALTQLDPAHGPFGSEIYYIKGALGDNDIRIVRVSDLSIVLRELANISSYIKVQGRQQGRQLWECIICGSFVSDRCRHVSWHERN